MLDVIRTEYDILIFKTNSRIFRIKSVKENFKKDWQQKWGYKQTLPLIFMFFHILILSINSITSSKSSREMRTSYLLNGGHPKTLFVATRRLDRNGFCLSRLEQVRMPIQIRVAKQQRLDSCIDQHALYVMLHIRKVHFHLVVVQISYDLKKSLRNGVVNFRHVWTVNYYDLRRFIGKYWHLAQRKQTLST